MARIITRTLLQIAEFIGTMIIIDLFCHVGYAKSKPMIERIPGVSSIPVEAIVILLTSVVIIVLLVMAMKEGSTVKQVNNLVANAILPIILAGLVYLLVTRLGVMEGYEYLKAPVCSRLPLIAMGIIIGVTIIVLVPISMIVKMMLKNKDKESYF